MPLNRKKVYSTIVDGLNDKVSPLLLRDEEAAEILNYEENERGILEKYAGFVKDHSPFPDDPDSFIRFLMNFKRGTSVDVLLMAALNETNVSPMQVDLRKTTGDGTSTLISAGLWHKDFIPRGVVFNNFAIMTNGSEAVQKYDNTTLSTIATAPEGRYIENHKSRVFIAATSGGPSTIYWSATNDETVWDAQAQETVYSQDNGNIISIKSFADSLIVLKNNGKIYQVVGGFVASDDDAVGGPDFIRPVDVPENMGIISERTPIVHNNCLYFLAETGLYRMDTRLFVEKVTYNIDNFIKGINFSLGPTTSKTFTYDTQSQWTTGNTLDGTRVIDGTLKNYFDLLTINDAKQDIGRASVAIDSSNNVHVAYVDVNNIRQIKYVKMLASDNSTTTEIAVNEASGEVHCVSLDVAGNGNVGIAYDHRTATINYQTRFVERTTSWQASQATDVVRTYTGTKPPPVAFKYTSGNDPRVAFGINGGIQYARRIAGVWDSPPQVAAGGGIWHHLSLVLNGLDNPRLSGYDSSSIQILLRQSDSDGDTGTWTTLDTVSISTLRDSDHLQMDLNASVQPITVWSDSTNTVRKRNHTTATTTTVLAANNISKGYQVFSDPDAGANLDYVYAMSSTPTERYVFEGSSPLINSTNNTINSSFRVGDRAMHNNSRVFTTISFGSNANELVLRRLSFRGEWQSAGNSDLTMTAWGTYDVAGQVTNSAAVTHEVKLGANPFTAITPGQIIQSPFMDNSIINKITYVLGAFASPEIGSIIDNYTGAGVDAKQAVGISFNNELYYACSEIMATANNRILISDRANSLIKTTHPVSSFERFKGKLYAGKSTNGDLIILKQGYNFDGAAYSSDFQSKEDLLEAIELDKDINKFYILYEVKDIGSFTFSYRLDSFKTPGGSSWQDFTVDQTISSNTPGIAEVLVGQKARSIQWRIQNTGVNQKVGLIAVVLVYDYLNRR